MEHEEQLTKLRSLVGSVRLTEVGLHSARLERIDGAELPSEPEVVLRTRATYQPTEKGFDCFHQFNLRVKDKEVNVVRLQVVFQVSYLSPVPMGEDLFSAFAETSLRLTTWPYFREYVHSTFARMNWPMFIAPTFRTGVQRAAK